MTLLAALQRLSGTKKDLAGAANAWAGTTGLETLGALNSKAGTKGLGMSAVLKALGGTEGDSGLDSVSATPAAPASASASPGSTQATLVWSAVTGTGSSAVTGYRITTSPGGTVTNVGTVTSTVITGLTNGIAYTFAIAAVNTQGAGPTITTNAATPTAGTTAPGAPTSVSGTRGNGQVDLTWVAPVSNGGAAITGYRVTTSPGGATTTVGNVTSTTITGLSNGTAYTFTVAATNSVGYGVESTASSALTPATTPGTPTSAAATAGDAQATVTWAAPASTGGTAITGYRVTASPGGVTADVGNVLTATVTGLTNATTYTFTVKALNAVGYGSDSTASGAVTPVLAAMSGMAAWFRAGDLSLSDGAAVAAWSDASPNGWGLSQGTSGNRPTYVASAVNSKPAVRFTATSSQYLQRTTSMPGFLNAATGLTVLAVCAINTTAATQELLFVSGGTDTSTTRARASFSATNRYPNPQARHTDADGSPVTATGTTGSNEVAGTYFVTTQNVDWATGSFAAFKNGTQVLTATGTLTAGAVSATDTQAMRIGCQTSALGLWLDGWVAELLVYPRTLSTSDRAAVTSYLGTKYGITVS